MKKWLVVSFMTLTAALLLAAENAAAPKPLSVSEIATMLRVHLDDHSILQDLYSRRLSATPTSAELEELRELGATASLMAALHDPALLAAPEVTEAYETRKEQAVREASRAPASVQPPTGNTPAKPVQKITLTPQMKGAVELSLAILEAEFILEGLRSLIPYYRNTVGYPELRAEIAKVGKAKAQFTEQLEELLAAMSVTERQELEKLAKLGYERELALRQGRLAQLEQLLSGGSGSLPVAKKEQVRQLIEQEKAAIQQLQAQAQQL